MTQYVYDGLGDVATERWKDGAAVVRTITYTYDADGEMLTASDPSASYTYVCDATATSTSTAASIAGLTPTRHAEQWYNAAG